MSLVWKNEDASESLREERMQLNGGFFERIEFFSFLMENGMNMVWEMIESI